MLQSDDINGCCAHVNVFDLPESAVPSIHLLISWSFQNVSVSLLI